MKYLKLILPAIFLYCQLQSQTLIINEVSNGPTGNQEYVEFVVVSNALTYTCTNLTPPCIDIRGWIFDDNSGYHGTGGVAGGAVRFSQDPMWACVPLGTIILIYNNGDRNPAIPPDDLSMADGNCTIIAPVNSTLFESNVTTPGAIACSYPATGWTPGGNWNTTLLANAGDCARIVDLNGCEVFSVCWVSNNLNNLIYFNSGGTTGSQNVWYFNGGNPTVQANWSEGSASPSPSDQTPGAPNNALNAAYIAQFNNGCMPITPLAISTPTLVNASCLCDGSATVNASGSIGGYTYVWYDSNALPIGQTSSTANGLCAGDYKVVATSYIGCKDSINVTILPSGATPTVNINNQTVCLGNSVVLTATPSAIGGSYLWSPGGQTTQTISVSPANTATYSVTYSVATCIVSNSAVVSVDPLPVIAITTSSPVICSSGQTASLSLSGSAGTYTWSNGDNSSSTTINAPGVYTATVSTPSCGSASTSITIGTSPLPTISISVPTTTLCSGSSLTFTANSSDANYLWDGGATTQTLSVNTSSIVVTTTNACGSAQASQTLNIVPIPTVTLSSNAISLCSGQIATVQANANTPVTYTWSSGVNTNTVSLNTAGIYTVNASNLCGTASATVNVTVNAVPTLSVSSSSPSICASGQTASLSLSGSTGTYSWSNGGSSSSTTINAPGVYTATVSTPSCGSASTTVTIGTSPLPTVSISVPTTTLCAGSALTFTANSSDANYLWTGGTTTQTVSVTSSPIVVTTTNTCGNAQASQTITIIPIPTVTLSANSFSLCAGQSATAQANVNTPVTYNWSSGANTNTVSLNAAGVYTVDVSNACGVATATVAVIITPLPTINASASQTLLCSGQTSLLSLTGSVGTILWSNGATTATTNVTNGGVYTVTVTAACGTAVSSVTIATQVTPTIAISASAPTICSGQTSTLTAISNVNNYTWSNGSFNNTTVVNTSGIVTVSVSNNCGVATESINITSGTLPVLTITPSSTLICPNETATLTVAGGSAPYTWSNSSNTGSVVIANGGSVTVSSTNACGTFTAISVVNVTNVNANFSANPTSGTVPLVVSFTNNSSGANSFSWNFGNGNSATTQNVNSQTYSAVGVYTVDLTAINGLCTDNYSLIISVLNEEATLIIPNVFTPNGDNSNDVFRVTGKNIIEFNCTIFNRWGLQLYYWDDIRNGWDGTTDNKLVPDGTYFYIINAKDLNYKEITKQGFLQLFQ
ncbi:MAG: gliding motility-associated C-terminal domain-containing protein [Bacteroidia bacterium]|nr:gliding motility-associated C-terminal domain-containing protein [Bacteroidia bacterium]